MNKGDLISKMATDSEISKAQATDALNSFIDALATTLKDGDKLSLIGFGTFSINDRPARTGRNPRTGEPIQIKAKKVVKFKAGKGLDEKVAGK